MTKAAAVFEDNGVDRPNRTGITAKLIEQIEHGPLTRVCYVQSVEAQPLGGRHDLWQRVDCKTERIEVDYLIDICQPVLGTFSLM